MDSFITVSGNLTRTPEIRFSDSGTSVVRFGIAVNRKRKNGEENTSFYDVVAFGSTAENLANSLSSGDRVIVAGHQEVRTFDKKDGTKGTAVEIVADEVGASFRFATASVAKNPRRTSEPGYDDSSF